MLPVIRLVPFTVSVAVAEPFAPAVRVPVPSETLPAANVIAPPGAVAPDAAFTVAVNTVDALCAMLAGLAATTVLVETTGAVAVTDVVPVDPAKLPLGVYVAVIAFAPRARLLPLTVSIAALAPRPAMTDTLPSEVAPIVKLTVPSGSTLPEAGLIVAVSCVVELCGMLVGDAENVTVVATGGAVTVTFTVPVDAANAVVPA